VIQRKITIQQILEEKEWSEAVIQGMPQVSYVFDLQGRIKRWNKNWEDISGHTAEELQDKFIGDFLGDEDRKKVMKEIQKVIEDGQERSVEYDIITKSGEILPSYYGSGKLVKIGGEPFIVGQTVDISKLKQAQRKIAAQLEEIQVLKEQLEAENIHLRYELLSTGSYGEIIGESDILKHILYRVEQVATVDTTVLLEGETGTGKAVALLPPLTAFGLLMGSREYSLAIGSLLLFLTNIICINLAGVITFSFAGGESSYLVGGE